jgi:hypothetical protein
VLSRGAAQTWCFGMAGTTITTWDRFEEQAGRQWRCCQSGCATPPRVGLSLEALLSSIQFKYRLCVCEDYAQGAGIEEAGTHARAHCFALKPAKTGTPVATVTLRTASAEKPFYRWPKVYGELDGGEERWVMQLEERLEFSFKRVRTLSHHKAHLLAISSCLRTL